MPTKQINYGQCRPLERCVIRSVNGEEMALPLEKQHTYKEWNGCFTYMGTQLIRPPKSPLTIREVANGMINRYGKTSAALHCADNIRNYYPYMDGFYYWDRVLRLIEVIINE